MRDVNPIWNRLIFVLSFLGLFVAGFLWHAHATNGDIPCGPSHGCEIVAASKYAHFPEGNGPFVAMYGTFGYLAFLVLAFLRTLDVSPSRDRLLLILITVGAVFGTIFSLRLTYLEIYELHAICKWCVTSQVIILGIMIVSLLELFVGSQKKTLKYLTLMKLTKEAKFLISIGGVVALGVGALALLNNMATMANKPQPAPTPPPAMTAAQMDTLFQKSRHQEGDVSAAVTVIEFADFQCPSCRRAYNKTLAKLLKTLPSHRLAFFNLPLPMHERAIPAAEAAEAAGKQDKFWPMYAALFDTKSEGLEDKKIQAAAQTAGLDMAKFATDLKQEAALKALVDGDMKIATEEHLDTTPTFYVHDKQGNTIILAGAGNLERVAPDLKDGIIGNDPIAPFDQTGNGAPIQITVGGHTEQK